MDESDARLLVLVDRGLPVDRRVAAMFEWVRSLSSDLDECAQAWRRVLSPILRDVSEDDAVRIAAVRAAAELEHGLVVAGSLAGAFSPEKPQIRRAVVATLHDLGQRPLSAVAERRLNEELAKLEPEIDYRPFANLTLMFPPEPRVVAQLRRGLGDGSPYVRSMAVYQLARIGDMGPAIAALTSQEDPMVQDMAAAGIGGYWTGEPEAIDALRAASLSVEPDVARAAKKALRELRLSKLPTPKRRKRAAKVAEVDPRFPWSEFLRRWSDELCRDEPFVLAHPDEMIESGWTGSAPASTDEIDALETRLGLPLPPSYRSFLATTNGYTAGGAVERIRPAREVKPFIEEESEWVDSWLESFSEGPSLTVEEHIAHRGQDVVDARWELLSDAIQISDADNSAVYLLCPTIADSDGEWEAWLFASWLPGAERFSSWWDLLNHQHQTWQTR